MSEKIRILFLSANPWNTSRILVDEEAREVSERLREGSYRDRFELINYPATRPSDLQRLLLDHRPHIVHFSGHGSKQQRIILNSLRGHGKPVDQQGLTNVFALYNRHVRLVLLNACFTKAHAQSIAEVVNYSIGTSRAIGDKVGVAFAGAFYRALGFGWSIRDAFESAKAELALTKTPRSRGIELFVRSGVSIEDQFPQLNNHRLRQKVAV
jgi:CHAT domain-containing protein